MIEFKIEAEPEGLYIREELSFEKTGVDNSEYIEKVEKDAGRNPWLWCTIIVTGKFCGLTEHEYLGACAFDSEEDFLASGYIEDMKQAILEQLQKQVDKIFEALKE